MSYPEFEYNARRLASDLNVGNTTDAAQVLRQELYRNPCETESLVNRAYQLSSPARRDDVFIDRGGGVTVRDRYTGYQEWAGRIPQYCRPGYPNPYPNPFPVPIPIPIPIPFPRRDHPHPGHPRHHR